MLNDALFYDSYEIIGGKKFMARDNLSDEERAEAKFDIKLSIFDDCTVNINDIFD